MKVAGRIIIGAAGNVFLSPSGTVKPSGRLKGLLATRDGGSEVLQGIRRRIPTKSHSKITVCPTMNSLRPLSLLLPSLASPTSPHSPSLISRQFKSQVYKDAHIHARPPSPPTHSRLD